MLALALRMFFNKTRQRERELQAKREVALAKASSVPYSAILREWAPEMRQEHCDSWGDWYHEDLEGVGGLRRRYRQIVGCRLECEFSPQDASAPARLRGAEDDMRAYVAKLTEHLRLKIWLQLRDYIDDELGPPADILWKIRSLYFHLTDHDYPYDPKSDYHRNLITELGGFTAEDVEFLRSREHLFCFDWQDALEAAGIDLLTEQGPSLAAQAYRDFRAEQDLIVDYFLAMRLREHLKGKRAQVGAAFPPAEEETAEAATIRGERFERHVAEVLSAEWPELKCQHLGTNKRTERGIDLLFTGSNGERIGVQCKQHAGSREPSYQEWQSFLGGCTFHKIPEGSQVFVTTGTISVKQRQEAKKLGVVVFYKDEFAAMASEHGIEPWR